MQAKKTTGFFMVLDSFERTNLQNQIVDVNPASKERIDYIDFLRVIAMFMVVTIHVAAYYLFDPTVAIGSKTWLIAHFFYTLSRSAVPVFIMISGLLQLSSEQTLSITSYLRKKSFRIILPLVFWSIIYLFWQSYKTGEAINVKDFLLNFLSGDVYFHLYFLYLIFGLFLLTPLLRAFVRSAKKQDLLYAIGLWLLAVAVFPLLQTFWGIRFYDLLIPISGYIGYYLAGYYFSKISRVKNYILVIIWMIANLVSYFGTLMMSKKAGEVDPFFYNYTSLTVIASAMALFVFVKQLDFPGFYARFPKLGKFFSLAASASYSVYLDHLILLDMLFMGTLGITVNINTFDPIVGIPLITAVVTIIPGLIVLVLRRIPIIRWLFP